MPFWSRSSPDAESGRQAPLPRIGEAVRLQVAQAQDGDASVGIYQAQVTAVGLRRLFLQTAELRAGAVLPARAALTVSFARGDALYRFETRLIGPPKAGTLIVARPRQVVRVQRRRFYRLPLEAPTTYRRLVSAADRVAGAPEAGRLVDLSGGGALLAAGRPVPEGSTVTLRVPAGKEGYPLNIDAEALDCRVAIQGTARVYLTRLRFFEPPRLAEEDREAIVAYLYEQQRQMLRARKLRQG